VYEWRIAFCFALVVDIEISITKKSQGILQKYLGRYKQVAVDKQSEFETKFLCFPPESVTVLIN
jgi:hypothetical protein